VRVVANRIRAYLDQDGKEPDDADLVNPDNTLRLRKKRDGRVEFAGSLGPVEGAKFEALLNPLCKPRPADAHGPDTRTVLERQGDGFVDLLDLASCSKDLPREAGQRPQVTVTFSWDNLLTGQGVATLGNGTLEWQHGGATDLDNTVLLCGHHHRVVHHTDWEIRMISRIPWFIPPALIDPERRPLRNPLRAPMAA